MNLAPLAKKPSGPAAAEPASLQSARTSLRVDPTYGVPLYLQASIERRMHGEDAQRPGEQALGVASAGVAHAAAPLPHLDEIQAAFGPHDVSDVRAAVAGEGGAAARRMGARAFAIGDRVAFSAEPDLRTAAHEAAHVVQQRAGVQLEGGVGRRKDGYERHADAVAEAVVAGRSVSALLDAHEGGGARTGVQMAPHATVARATDPQGAGQLVVFTEFRGAVIVLQLRPDADTMARFDADSTLADQLGAALFDLFNPLAGPVPETSAFLVGPLVRPLVEEELPLWTLFPRIGFPALAVLLAARAEAMRRQKVRLELEQALGVDPGTVDWHALLPTLRDEAAAMGGSSLREQSNSDRVEMFLMILEAEVAGSPPVVGGVVPPNLTRSVWSYALAYRFPDPETDRMFSEKLLGPYVDMLAALEFVPADFDIERFRPTGTDAAAAERHRTIDEWVGWAGPELASKYVLDQWTTSGLDFQVFLATLDVDAEKREILDFIADEYMKQARQNSAMMRSIVHMAGERAGYDLLVKFVAAGRAAEKASREIQARIDAPDPRSDEELEKLIANPRSAFENAFYLAYASRSMLSAVAAGARVEGSLVASAAAIAGKADLSPNLALGAFLMTLLTDLGELQRTLAEQRALAREEIAERVDLSWDAIKKIIDERGEKAEVFLETTWIPTLKAVATEWVTANYDEIKDFYDNFDVRVPQTAGRYRLAAWFIEDTANQLESGAAKSVTLGGQTVTVEDVEDLRDAVKVLRAKAEQLESPSGKEQKREALEKAIEAYGRVKSNIADGTYKPKNYGEDVVVEAKKRLGIGLFEYASLWQQATRQVTVRENPFLAYTVAMWRVENIIDDAAANLLGGFLKGLLTVASLLVPGVGGLVLAGIDIAIGLYGAGKNVGEAKRRLDLARLDTQLNVQGLTVEQAEHAVTMAWVSFVIEAVLAGIFTVLVGGAAIKGIQNLRLPNLAKLAEADAALAAKLVEQMNGDARLVDSLLGHYAGDASKLVEALAYVKDGKALLQLVGKVKDAELLTSLLIGAGSDAKLLELFEKFKDVEKLNTLLGAATPGQLLKLFDLAKSELMVARLVEGMGPFRATRLLESGLAADEALTLNRLGDNAVFDFFRLAGNADAEGSAAIRELLRLNQKGSVSSEVAASALQRTADFTQTYAGRVSGDFVSRFTRVAAEEHRVARIQAEIEQLRAAGRETAAAETTLAGAQTQLSRARAETETAVDILEGRTALGEGRSVTALPESKIKGVETPEFRVSGSGRPDTLVEVKAIGEEGKLGKDAISRNFRKAASQISGQAASTGEKAGWVRLDASATGKFTQTNEQIRATIQGQWRSSLQASPGRASDIAWVEVLDRGPAGPSRLLLKVDGPNVTIVAGGTTRVDP